MTVSRGLTSLLAALVLTVTGAIAAAAVVASATGTIKINGQEVTVTEGEPVSLPEGATVESLDSTVEIVTDAGDRITLRPGSEARAEGTKEGVEYIFVDSGSAFGTLSDKTSLGATAGWASAPEGQSVRVYIEVPKERAGGEATFRSLEGDAWVRYHTFRALVRQQHTLTLAVDPARPDILAFRSGQQNPGDIEIVKSFGTGELSVLLPKASIGRIEPAAGNKTRVENDITSLKTNKLRLETRFGGEPRRAALGPGAYALIDNATGNIEVSFTAVEFVILERAVSLTSEFATLAQSNFSDLDGE